MESAIPAQESRYDREWILDQGWDFQVTLLLLILGKNFPFYLYQHPALRSLVEERDQRGAKQEG